MYEVLAVLTVYAVYVVVLPPPLFCFIQFLVTWIGTNEIQGGLINVIQCPIFLGEYQSFEKLTQGLVFFLQKQSVVYPIKHHWGDETYCAKWARWIDHLDLVFFSLKMGRKRKCCRRHYHNKPRHLHRGGPVNDCGVNKDDKKFEFFFHTCEVCWGLLINQLPLSHNFINQCKQGFWNQQWIAAQRPMHM